MIEGNAGHLLELIEDGIGRDGLQLLVGEHLSAEENVGAVGFKGVERDGDVVTQLSEAPLQGFDDLAIAHCAVDGRMNDVDEVESSRGLGGAGFHWVAMVASVYFAALWIKEYPTKPTATKAATEMEMATISKVVKRAFWRWRIF